MSSTWTFLSSEDNRTLREKVVGVYALLFAANVAAWIWAICLSREFPMTLGIAALAYSLGLRHGLDADHIAAIDNVTRKFMQKGERPIGVGAYFSLGHSTVVVGLTIAIALTTTALHGEMASFRSIGGVVGAVVSSLFLLAIALTNAFALHSIYATFRAVTRRRKSASWAFPRRKPQRACPSGKFWSFPPCSPPG